MFLNLSDKDLDRNIYRIIPLPRLVELFRFRKNVLVKPHKWDDPYENFILRSKVRLTTGEIIEYYYHDWFYGQCWTFHKETDAMWRIYSPNSNSVKIRTTIRQLVTSLYSYIGSLPEVKCYVGKVLYLGERKLKAYSNDIFDDAGVLIENLFKSLLVKRWAFRHENEVRLLYMEMDDQASKEDDYSYDIDPNSFITQIVIDPRVSNEEANELKSDIVDNTGYNGEIKRSLLYSFSNDIVISAKEFEFSGSNS